jgi:hypothetical protein
MLRTLSSTVFLKLAVSVTRMAFVAHGLAGCSSDWRRSAAQLDVPLAVIGEHRYSELNVRACGSTSEAGHDVPFSVPAACYWADTGIRVEKGKSYAVNVVDFTSVWDAYLPVRDFEGWPPSFSRIVAAPLFWMRRRPFDPWFSVIATVERRHPVRLRADRPYLAPTTGELVCYFNDSPWAYGNNRGVARLRIVKLKRTLTASRPL